jgi:hypothetical protein
MYLFHADTTGERSSDLRGLEVGRCALATAPGEDFVGEGFILLALSGYS